MTLTNLQAGYTPITVMPHCYAPPSQVGGGWGLCLTPAACPLEGAFALYGELLLYVGTLCGPARRQLGQIPNYAPTPTNLRGWENSDNCI